MEVRQSFSANGPETDGPRRNGSVTNVPETEGQGGPSKHRQTISHSLAVSNQSSVSTNQFQGILENIEIYKFLLHKYFSFKSNRYC